MPPRVEQDSIVPYRASSAAVAQLTSSNSTKHIGPFEGFWRKDMRLKPISCLNKSCSSASIAFIGKLPTYNVLQGGFSPKTGKVVLNGPDAPKLETSHFLLVTMLIIG